MYKRGLGIALGVVLAAGLLVASPLKGSLLHPQPAAACGTWHMVQNYTDYTFYDYYYSQWTFARVGVEIWTNDCAGATWQVISYAYIDDHAPAYFQLDMQDARAYWYPGCHIDWSNTGSGSYGPYQWSNYTGTASITGGYFASDCSEAGGKNWTGARGSGVGTFIRPYHITGFRVDVSDPWNAP